MTDDCRSSQRYSLRQSRRVDAASDSANPEADGSDNQLRRSSRNSSKPAASGSADVEDSATQKRSVLSPKQEPAAQLPFHGEESFKTVVEEKRLRRSSRVQQSIVKTEPQEVEQLVPHFSQCSLNDQEVKEEIEEKPPRRSRRSCVKNVNYSDLFSLSQESVKIEDESDAGATDNDGEDWTDTDSSDSTDASDSDEPEDVKLDKLKPELTENKPNVYTYDDMIAMGMRMREDTFQWVTAEEYEIWKNKEGARRNLLKRESQIRNGEFDPTKPDGRPTPRRKKTRLEVWRGIIATERTVQMLCLELVRSYQVDAIDEQRCLRALRQLERLPLPQELVKRQGHLFEIINALRYSAYENISALAESIYGTMHSSFAVRCERPTLEQIRDQIYKRQCGLFRHFFTYAYNYSKRPETAWRSKHYRSQLRILKTTGKIINGRRAVNYLKDKHDTSLTACSKEVSDDLINRLDMNPKNWVGDVPPDVKAAAAEGGYMEFVVDSLKKKPRNTTNTKNDDDDNKSDENDDNEDGSDEDHMSEDNNPSRRQDDRVEYYSQGNADDQDESDHEDQHGVDPEDGEGYPEPEEAEDPDAPSRRKRKKFGWKPGMNRKTGEPKVKKSRRDKSVNHSCGRSQGSKFQLQINLGSASSSSSSEEGSDADDEGSIDVTFRKVEKSGRKFAKERLAQIKSSRPSNDAVVPASTSNSAGKTRPDRKLAEMSSFKCLEALRKISAMNDSVFAHQFNPKILPYLTKAANCTDSLIRAQARAILMRVKQLMLLRKAKKKPGACIEIDGLQIAELDGANELQNFQAEVKGGNFPGTNVLQDATISREAGEVVYKCSHCFKAFCNERLLVWHTNDHHRLKTEAEMVKDDNNPDVHPQKDHKGDEGEMVLGSKVESTTESSKEMSPTNSEVSNDTTPTDADSLKELYFKDCQYCCTLASNKELKVCAKTPKKLGASVQPATYTRESDGPPYKCKYCPLESKKRSYMDAHKDLHRQLGILPFQCEYCHGQFKTFQAKSVHQYQCPLKSVKPDRIETSSQTVRKPSTSEEPLQSRKMKDNTNHSNLIIKKQHRQNSAQFFGRQTQHRPKRLFRSAWSQPPGRFAVKLRLRSKHLGDKNIRGASNYKQASRNNSENDRCSKSRRAHQGLVPKKVKKYFAEDNYSCEENISQLDEPGDQDIQSNLSPVCHSKLVFQSNGTAVPAIRDTVTHSSTRKTAEKRNRKIEATTSTENQAMPIFIEGDFVWATVPGYPKWPAIIETDPEKNRYYNVNNAKLKDKISYHVTFIEQAGQKSTHAWTRGMLIKAFGNGEDAANFMTPKNKKTPMILNAVNQAKAAVNWSTQERLSKFGRFCTQSAGRTVKKSEGKKEKMNSKLTSTQDEKDPNDSSFQERNLTWNSDEILTHSALKRRSATNSQMCSAIKADAVKNVPVLHTPQTRSSTATQMRSTNKLAVNGKNRSKRGRNS